MTKNPEMWTKGELPIDPMLNLIGYIDTPVGRKQYPADQVQELKKWIEENNLNYLK